MQEGGSLFVWARVVPPEGRSRGGTIQRTDWLTPYAALELATDALWAGRGARLELWVDAATDPNGIDRLRDQFAWLGRRGVEVSVGRRAS
jgi:hypothetical protein